MTVGVARMEQRGIREMGRGPRITLRCIRATGCRVSWTGVLPGVVFAGGVASMEQRGIREMGRGPRITLSCIRAMGR